MKHLKYNSVLGVFFVLILGSLSHFFYEWSGNSYIVGLFTPVNESTWEHMKLVFFPMLLYSFIIIPKLKETFPCVASSLLLGIVSGTLSIPVIFYTYTGILGYHIFFMDLLTFAISVMAAFYSAYKLTLSCKTKKHTILLLVLTCLLGLCFLLFTYAPPKLGLFADPTIS